MGEVSCAAAALATRGAARVLQLFPSQRQVGVAVISNRFSTLLTVPKPRPKGTLEGVRVLNMPKASFVCSFFCCIFASKSVALVSDVARSARSL